MPASPWPPRPAPAHRALMRHLATTITGMRDLVDASWVAQDIPRLANPHPVWSLSFVPNGISAMRRGLDGSEEEVLGDGSSHARMARAARYQEHFAVAHAGITALRDLMASAFPSLYASALQVGGFTVEATIVRQGLKPTVRWHAGYGMAAAGQSAGACHGSLAELRAYWTPRLAFLPPHAGDTPAHRYLYRRDTYHAPCPEMVPLLAIAMGHMDDAWPMFTADRGHSLAYLAAVQMSEIVDPHPLRTGLERLLPSP